jgi:hypothetical protein
VIRLGTADVARVVDAVHEINGAVSVREFPVLAMAVAGRLVQSEVTSFNDVDPTRLRAVAAFDPPDATFFDGAFERFAQLQSEHPVIHYISETGDGSAKKISDFMSRDEFHRSKIYREFYALVGVEFQISVTLPAALPRIVAIVLNRSEVGTDFDERDRICL